MPQPWKDWQKGKKHFRSSVGVFSPTHKWLSCNYTELVSIYFYQFYHKGVDPFFERRKRKKYTFEWDSNELDRQTQYEYQLSCVATYCLHVQFPHCCAFWQCDQTKIRTLKMHSNAKIACGNGDWQCGLVRNGKWNFGVERLLCQNIHLWLKLA